MRSQCLDEGTIQSYLDGELPQNLTEKTVAHLASCDDCALALSEAQDELEMLSVALEPELSLPVPTESLRERINLAIAAETQRHEFTEPKTSRFSGWLSTLTASFAFKPQYAIGFATVLFAVLIGTLFLISNKNSGGMNAIAGVDNRIEMPDADAIPNAPTTEKKVIENSQSKVIHKVRRDKKEVDPNAPLAEEKSYLQAIASLEKAIKEQGDLNTRPTLLAEYERSLAVINRAISETQKDVRSNPKDKGAAQLLYASYQSKIDLLNVVSNQNQLYAALR